MTFDAEIVWGCAVAADRINGGYVKDTEWDHEQVPPVVKREANKVMVKGWLRNNDFSQVTEQDRAVGLATRNYFNGFLLRELSGKLNDFERQVLRIAQMEQFGGRNLLEFATICYLPEMQRRDSRRSQLAHEVRMSTQLTGRVGDTVQGEVEVVKCLFSQHYNRFRITARLVDSFVDFWYNKNMEVGQCLRIKGKIKAQRDDNVTQLNYVKVC